MAMQATQPGLIAEVDPAAITRPAKGPMDKILSKLAAIQAKMDSELGDVVDFSKIAIGNVPIHLVKGGGAIFDRMVQLYLLGFLRDDWGEVNDESIAATKLDEQLDGKGDEDIAITILRYDKYVHGFITSQILPREEALVRVASSVIGYRQEEFNNEEYRTFLQELKSGLERVLASENSYTKNWNFQSRLSVMEDIVVDRHLSGLPSISKMIHENISSILERHNEAGDRNPYMITWTNKANPIYKFLIALGYPHEELAEITRRVKAKNKDGVMEERDITLVAFAINLKDLVDITTTPGRAKFILASRGLKNDPWGTIKALGGSLRKKGAKLQTSLSRSIFNRVNNSAEMNNSAAEQ